jgi:hypothetical protein
MLSKLTFPDPLHSSRPNSHVHLAVVVRPVENLALRVLGQMVGEDLFHVGLLDVPKELVYHVNDPVGNSNASGPIQFCETTLEKFGETAIYYHEHNLTESQQIEALEKARNYLKSPIPYDGVFVNCQTILLDIMYNRPDPQQVILAQRAINYAFDFWARQIPIDADGPPADSTPPEKMDEVMVSLVNTTNESLKAGAKVATVVVAGGVIFGPPGILVGSVLGGLLAWGTSNDFSSVLQIYQGLTPNEKILVIKRLQALAVVYGASTIRILMAYRKELIQIAIKT